MKQISHSIHGAVLITGCSSGIGLDCALTLAERGVRVIASARNDADVERLHQLGLTAISIDLASSESIHKGFEQAVALCNGELYGVVHNGAFGQVGAIEDLSRQLLREQFETNVFGTMELNNLALRLLRTRERGRVVLISSVLGFVGLPFRGAYCASKYALEGLADTLRLELTGSGVSVALIEPGPIETQFRANALARFNTTIDWESSTYKEHYAAQLHRLKRENGSDQHSLAPAAVTQAIIHALSAPQPRPRYRITRPTKIAYIAKRLLPTRWFDALLRRSDST